MQVKFRVAMLDKRDWEMRFFEYTDTVPLTLHLRILFQRVLVNISVFAFQDCTHAYNLITRRTLSCMDKNEHIFIMMHSIRNVQRTTFANMLLDRA